MGVARHRAREAASSTLGVRTVASLVATRLAVFAVAVAVAYLAARHEGATLGFRGLLVAPWTHKDAGWFASIAQQGYGPHEARTAFFPLYPLLVRVVSYVTLGSVWAAGLAVSLASYAGAMLLLYRLTAAETTRRTAAVTVLLISVFPTAFVFGAVYSESLFLLLSVATFWLARRRQWLPACAAGFLATLTRSSGIVLVAPLLIMFAEQHGWTARRLRWRPDAAAAWVLLVPAGLAAYMVFLWARFGRPLLFMRVQGTSWHRALAWPWADVWRGARAAAHGLNVTYTNLWLLPSGAFPGHRLEVVMVRNVVPFAALLFAVFCLVVVFRKLPLAYGAYAALALLVPLLEPSATSPLYSFHRFVLVVFPLFIGLALVLEDRKRLLWGVAIVSFVLMLYFTACYASPSLAAHGVV